MNELQNLVFTEKYRPNKFEDLILENKSLILNYLKNPEALPSFILHSNRAGTGKTSTARTIINFLDCDYLVVNSSDERGIDTIRDKIKLFASSLSTNTQKRCVFMDEFDGMTKQAQDCLRNLMETYANNCFFIFSCNDINKIIEPIRSRCVCINFEKPDRTEIVGRLMSICELEEISTENIETLVNTYYPDIRTMINKLQECKVEDKIFSIDEKNFIEFLNLIRKKQISELYTIVYSGSFQIIEFNKWLFHYIFKNYQTLGQDKASQIAFLLADNEKYWNEGVNLEIMFMSNIIKICNLM